ncbi:hypothetical protein IV54_GL000825 [Levilactobacillus paucivorans]|uniref:Antitoxin of toxin-antitoxin stability system n=1 Tax=Levilactobacillus paucivorans TaxID=616990 RepID=A0A0R2LZE4_9LACO|nr:hypothetical protein [Levilactobacillus paucivorans]KRO04800.1 hypothetical protein IV54_GL000825 [Levilactobacillus paucivorans]
MKSIKKQNLTGETVLPIPKEIEANADYYDVYSGRNKAIVYLPKVLNPFNNAEFIKTHQHALLQDDRLKPHLRHNEF